MKMNQQLIKKATELANQWGNLVKKTTPGDWHVSFLDDDHFRNCVAITLEPQPHHPALPHDDPDGSIRDSIVATTLIQGCLDASPPNSKPFVRVEVDKFDLIDGAGDEGGRWDEDAEFIAFAHNARPDLTIQELIKELENLTSSLVSLTPGGSEYANDPWACIQYLNDCSKETIETPTKLLRERNELRAVVQVGLDVPDNGCNDY